MAATRFSRFHSSDRIFHMHTPGEYHKNEYVGERVAGKTLVEGRDRSMRSRQFAQKLRPEISQRGKKKMGRDDERNFNDNSCEDSISNFIFLLR